MFDFDSELKKLPDKPGIYIMKDDNQDIIYVGKAKNLKKRVSSYFNKTNEHMKVKSMVSKISEFEYIIVDNEVEALVLESNLIKRYIPKYNIVLRDDKSYPYIKISNESYPRLFKTRILKKDGAKYFGPYPNALSVNEVVDIVNTELKLRSCKLNIEKVKGKIRPCLNYFINKCSGPCLQEFSQEDYKELIDRAAMIISGKDRSLQRELEAKMNKYSENYDFEKAGEYYEKIKAFKDIYKEQKISNPNEVNRDIVAYAAGINDVLVELFNIRGGKIIESSYYLFENEKESSPEDIIKAFVTQHYSNNVDIPSEIIVEFAFDGMEEVGNILSKLKGSSVKIIKPLRGEKKAQLLMVKKNAIDMVEKHADRYYRKKEIKKIAMNKLKDLLNFTKDIKRIECYDISHISGTDGVASMVVYEDFKMNKSEYRRFKIKTVEGQDDYASLCEVLKRRFAHSDEKFAKIPDLIALDGGKGQVSKVLKLIEETGIKIEIIGLKKDDKHRTDTIIYKDKEIKIKKDEELFKILSEIQDEAHRFAITYHRSLRDKAVKKSILDEISGIGEKRKAELLKYFPSIDDIRNAGKKELMNVPLIDEKTALKIIDYFGK